MFSQTTIDHPDFYLSQYTLDNSLPYLLFIHSGRE